MTFRRSGQESSGNHDLRSGHDSKRPDGADASVGHRGRNEHESLAELGKEVRTHLQTIVGAASLLLDTPLTREQSTYVTYVSTAADDLKASVARTEAELSILAEVASNRAENTLERILGIAREVLGMDVSYVAEFTEDQMSFRALEGDAASFGWRAGERVPLDGTYCRRVVGGEIPTVVPDARADGRVAPLDITREADIGAYVGLPLRFSDGRVYGTLCCLSHAPNPHLQTRDVKFMEVLARLVADQLERAESEANPREGTR